MKSSGASHATGGPRSTANAAVHATLEVDKTSAKEGLEPHERYVAELAHIFAECPDKATFMERTTAVDERFWAARHALRFGTPLADPMRASREQPVGGVVHAARPRGPPPLGLAAPGLTSPDISNSEGSPCAAPAQTLLGRNLGRMHRRAVDQGVDENAGCHGCRSQKPGDGHAAFVGPRFESGEPAYIVWEKLRHPSFDAPHRLR